MLKAVLAMEDGTFLTGKGFGHPCEVTGEVVFNTGMTGYTESLTDPSYHGQILIQTYPMIGNYGVPTCSIVDKFGIPLHYESNRIQVRGYVVHSLTKSPSHWSNTETLNEWLCEQRIPGIEDIDTRELTKKIRVKGTMLGVLKVAEEIDLGHVEGILRNMMDPDEMDLVKEVTTLTSIAYRSGESPNVVLIDCGAKFGIIRNLLQRGIDVTRVPYNCSFDEVIGLNPSGIVVSNGPGNPEKCDQTIQTLKELLEADVPTMGICLGNQIIALAAGAETFKLRFGHRGQNHPCVDSVTGCSYITSQNHGYAVNEESLKKSDFDVWFKNLNDGTVEGIKHRKKPIFGIQFHPEASPGPFETGFLFDYFAQEVRKSAKA